MIKIGDKFVVLDVEDSCHYFNIGSVVTAVAPYTKDDTKEFNDNHFVFVDEGGLKQVACFNTFTLEGEVFNKEVERVN